MSSSLGGIVCVALSITACVSASTVPSELARTIPNDARAIRLFSDQPAATYYQTVYRSLVARGFGIAQENAQMGTLSTQTKDIGQNTLLKVTVYVQDTTGGAVATLHGQWEVTAEMLFTGGASEARWGSMGRSKRAFGEMAVIANEVPHTRIEYVSR
jgi:hypothetical protein